MQQPFSFQLDHMYNIKHSDHSGAGGKTSCFRCAIEHAPQTVTRKKALTNLWQASQQFSDAQMIRLIDDMHTMMSPFYVNHFESPGLADVKALTRDMANTKPGRAFYNILVRSLSPELRKAVGDKLATQHAYRVFEAIGTMLIGLSKSPSMALPHETAVANALVADLRQFDIIKVTCDVVESGDRPSLKTIAVFFLHCLLSKDPTQASGYLPIADKQRLFRTLTSFSRLDTKAIQDELSKRENSWQVGVWGRKQVAGHEYDHLLQYIPRRWGLGQEQSLVTLQIVFNRPDGVVPRTEALQILEATKDTTAITDLLDMMQERLSYRVSYPETDAYVQSADVLVLLSSIPQYPYSKYFEKNAKEKQAWTASMKATDLVSQTSDYYPKVKHAWTRKRKETIKDVERSFAISRKFAPGAPLGDMEGQQVNSSNLLIDIFRLVINSTYLADEKQAPLTHLLPWLPLAYGCLTPPTAEEKWTLVASDFDTYLSRANMSSPDDRSRFCVGPMKILAPTLCLRILLWLLQPEQYSILTSQDADKLAASPFANLSDSELVNIKRMITEPYLKAVFKRAHVAINKHREFYSLSVGSGCEHETAGIWLSVIELSSAMLSVAESIHALGLAMKSTLDLTLMQLDHLDDLARHAVDFHIGKVEDFDKTAGTDRPERIMQMVADKVKSVRSTDAQIRKKVAVINRYIERIWRVVKMDRQAFAGRM